MFSEEKPIQKEKSFSQSSQLLTANTNRSILTEHTRMNNTDPNQRVSTALE